MDGFISVFFIVLLYIRKTYQTDRIEVDVLFAYQRDLILPYRFEFVTHKFLLVSSLL